MGDAASFQKLTGISSLGELMEQQGGESGGGINTGVYTLI
jgi:hypothetical protein